MTGGEATQPADPLALVLGERWIDEGSLRHAGFRRSLAVALCGHLVLATALLGGLEAVGAALFGAPPGPARRIGDKAGQIDGVAAEIIDAAEFNRRYIAFKAGSAAADSDPAARPPAEAAAPPERPPETPVAALKPADGWAPAAPEPAPDRERERPEAKQQTRQARPALTEAEMQELLAQSLEDVENALLSVSAPGAARLGEASPFVRSVIRVLKANMPRARGLRGSVVVQLVVGATGEVEAIRVVRGSGKPELDRLVVERVQHTRLAIPPAGTPLKDRLFQITYDYR